MIKKISALILLFSPIITFAAPSDSLMKLFVGFVNFVNIVIVFLIALATLVFLWGILSYVIYGNNENKKTEARGYIVYGLWTLFVMVSIWGITNLILKVRVLYQVQIG